LAGAPQRVEPGMKRGKRASTGHNHIAAGARNSGFCSSQGGWNEGGVVGCTGQWHVERGEEPSVMGGGWGQVRGIVGCRSDSERADFRNTRNSLRTKGLNIGPLTRGPKKPGTNIKLFTYCGRGGRSGRVRIGVVPWGRPTLLQKKTQSFLSVLCKGGYEETRKKARAK